MNCKETAVGNMSLLCFWLAVVSVYKQWASHGPLSPTDQIGPVKCNRQRVYWITLQAFQLSKTHCLSEHQSFILAKHTIL